VTLSEIDSIRVVTEPQFYLGQLASDGLIHLYSHRPSSGFLAYGRYAAGQETGDPGAFRSTALSAPNIDQSGPEFSATVGYGNETWYASATGLAQDEPASDPRVRARNGAWRVEEFRTPLNAGSLQFGLRTANMQHDVLLNHSRYGEYYFLMPFGREIPNTRKTWYAGITGVLDAGSRNTVSYRVAHDRQGTEERENVAGVELDFDRELTAIQLEFGRRIGMGTVRVGAEQSWLDVKTAYQLTDDGFTLTRGYGIVDFAPAPLHRGHLGVQLTASGGEVAFGGVGRYQWHVSSRHSLGATLAYSEQLPEQDGRIWFWDRRGYDLLGDLNHPVRYDGDLGTSRRFSADATWSFDISRVLALTVGGFYRNFLSADLETGQFMLQTSDSSFFGSTDVVTRQALQVAGGDVRFQVTFAPKWQLRSYFRHQRAFGGEELARRLWNAYPNNRFHQTVTFTPVDAFSMWLRFQYRESTDWFNYRDIEGQTNGEYSSQLPAYALLDLAIDKWFWKRRLRANLAFRNLLNDTVILHPIGARFDLGFHIQVEVRLDPIKFP